MSFYTVIPVFNEEKNIGLLCADLERFLPDHSQIVWIDDGSQDQTCHEIETQCKLMFTLLRQPINLGPGTAFELGFNFLLDKIDDNDLILTIEGDNTSDLQSLGAMINAAKHADLVLASVYAVGGAFEQTNWLRMILSQTVNQLVRLRFGLKQKTLTSFYRIYKGNLLKKLYQKNRIFCIQKGFICKMELLVKSRNLGVIIAEIPTVLRSSRRKGNSKIKLMRTAFECLLFCIRGIR